MKMLAMRNGIRDSGLADFWGFWDELKEWARRNVTNETIARNGLAFAGAVSMCYVAVQLVQSVHNFLAYAY